MPINNFRTPEGDLENQTYITESWLIDQWIGDELWVWGKNTVGQLGITNTSDRITPVTTFAGGNNWKQISCGDTHAAAIKTDGTLWVWGSNLFCQLGINNTLSRSTPVTTFAGGNNWKQVSCGTYSTAAIKTDGTLWVWGYNYDMQLGINSSGNRSTPVTTFAGGNNWKQVSLGYTHSSAIKTDGTLWVWGANNFTYGALATLSSCQLGTNDGTTRSTPVTTFAGGNNWKQVSCGFHHTSAVKMDGTLWLWGNNANGKLGTNDIFTRSTPITTFAGGNDWKQTSCNGNFTSCIKNNGTLWVWGLYSPFLGSALGIGGADFTEKSTPVTTFAGGNNWKQVSVGYNFMSAIKTDGTLWTWGSNSTPPDTIVPSGQLGTNDTTTRNTPVTTFAGGKNWKQISCGSVFMGAITSGPDY